MSYTNNGKTREGVPLKWKQVDPRLRAKTDIELRQLARGWSNFCRIVLELQVEAADAPPILRQADS